MTTTTRTTPDAFAHAVAFAMTVSPRVDEYLSHGTDYSQHACFLSPDGLAGFAISPRGDLQSVFNIGGPGVGRALVEDAAYFGATTLDCFDGFLPPFYASMGWHEIRREANWTPGGPDVVYMAR